MSPFQHIGLRVPVDPQRVRAAFGRPPSAAERAGVREVVLRFYFPRRARPGPLPGEVEAALGRVADAWEEERLRGAFRAAMGLAADREGAVAPLDIGDSRTDSAAAMRAAESGHEESVREFFREHVIRIGTMTREMRLIAGIGAAQLVAALLLILLSTRTWPQVPVEYALGGDASITGVFTAPIPVVALAVVFLAAAWTYVIAGMLHMRGPVRFLGIALFLFFSWISRSAIAPTSSWRFVALVPLLGLVALGAGAELWDRRHAERPHGRGVVSTTVLATLALVLATYVSAWMGRNPSQFTFTLAMTDQMRVLGALLVPALLLAGVDFAEWSHVVSSRLTALTARRSRPWLTVGLLALLLGILAWTLVVREAVPDLLNSSTRGQELLRLLIGVLAVGAAALVIVAVRAHHRGAVRRMPYLAVAATVFGSYLVGAAFLEVMATIRPGTPTPVVSGTLPPSGGLPSSYTENVTVQYHLFARAVRVPTAFVVPIPENWSLTRTEHGVVYSGTAAGVPASIAVSVVPQSDPAAGLDAALSELTGSGAPLDGAGLQTTDDLVGRYLHRDFSSTRLGIAGEAYSQVIDGRTWVLSGWCPPASSTTLHPLFVTALAGLSPGEDVFVAGLPPQEKDKVDTDVTETFYSRFATSFDVFYPLLNVGLVAGIAGLIVTALLVLLSRRSRRLGTSRSLATGAAFLGSVSAFALLNQSSIFIRFVGGFFDPGTVNLGATGRGFPGVQVVVAVVSIVLFALVLVRRRTAEIGPVSEMLLALNLSIAGIALLFDFLDQALFGHLPVPEAIFILVALCWDILMSGEAITNRDTERGPRHARLLLYFGYVMLVSSLLLYFSSYADEDTGAAVAPPFNSDFWPQHGMLEFGVPLVITVVMVNAFRWWRDRAPAPVPAAINP